VEKSYFEDCQIGDRVVAAGRTITETDVTLFAALTGDWHPLHTNVEYAKTTIFGERIVHGLLGLAIGCGFLFQASPNSVLPKFVIAAGKLDKARFVRPIKIGDTIHLESEVTQVMEIDGERGLITARHRIINQQGKDVLTFTTKTVARRRPCQEG